MSQIIPISEKSTVFGANVFSKHIISKYTQNTKKKDIIRKCISETLWWGLNHQLMVLVKEKVMKVLSFAKSW